MERFSEALRMPELLPETPIGFDIRLKCGGVRASLRAKSQILTDADLTIAVEPENDPDAKELYVALGDWARTYGPKLYERICLHLKLPAIFIVIALAVAFLIWKAVTTPTPPSPARQEAHSLLDKGLRLATS